MLIILIIVIILIICWGVGTYNSLVSKQTDTDQSWSQIDVQLKRRNDLIPNLVATVKGYANFESNTLQQVIKYRGQMVHIDADSSGKLSRQQMMNVSNQLSGALKSLFAVSENYPKLQANSDFQDLMEQLTTTENQIAYARQNYNSTIAVYDRSLRQFPTSIIAGMTHFSSRNYLQTPDSEKATPKVDFSDLDSNQNNNNNNVNNNTNANDK